MIPLGYEDVSFAKLQYAYFTLSDNEKILTDIKRKFEGIQPIPFEYGQKCFINGIQRVNKKSPTRYHWIDEMVEGEHKYVMVKINKNWYPYNYFSVDESFLTPNFVKKIICETRHKIKQFHKPLEFVKTHYHALGFDFSHYQS